MAVIGRTEDGEDIINIILPRGMSEAQFLDMLHLFAERQLEMTRKYNTGEVITYVERMWRDLAAIDIAATLVEPMVPMLIGETPDTIDKR